MQIVMKLQQFLAIHRNQVNRTFLTLEILILVGWLAAYLEAINNFDSIFLFIYNAGLRLGNAAVIFYVITLTPGIITRLQWFPKYTQPIASLILPFRRHFGILMFLSAFVHMSFTTTLPYFAQHNFQPPTLLPRLAQFQLMGLIAWCCLFPMWLTSNDFSQKKLGKNWKVLHRLTYFALIFIFLHTALQKTVWMWVVVPYLVLEALSWIVQWRREAAKLKTVVQPQPVQPVPQPPSNPQV